MEYLDFELPIKELEDKYKQTLEIGEGSEVDVTDTVKKIEKGEKFTRSNIDVLRPNLGIPASQFRKLLKRKSKKNYSAFSPLKWEDF